jgi:hypothetical protein
MFPMDFMEAVKNAGNQPEVGKHLFSFAWVATAPKIDPGPRDPFVFYLFHFGPQFVRITPPKLAVFFRLGEHTPNGFAIEQPMRSPPILLSSYRQNR